MITDLCVIVGAGLSQTSPAGGNARWQKLGLQLAMAEGGAAGDANPAPQKLP
jgi:hypothetical protein